MRHLNKLLFITLIISSSIAAASPHELLGKLLDDISSIAANFEQSTTDSSGEIVNLSDGRLSVGSGGKFNIETRQPFEQHLVSDGADFFTYDPDLEQVVIRKLVNDVNQVPILLLGDAQPDFLEQYEITQVDEEQHQQFLLRAKAADSVFESLRLMFVGDQPRRIILTDSLGQTTAIALSQVQMNSKICDKRFSFVIPDGVDVIDDR